MVFDPPKVPWLRVIGGVYDGEGRNHVENVDGHFFYAGRIEVTPWGRDIALTKYQE